MLAFKKKDFKKSFKTLLNRQITAEEQSQINKMIINNCLTYKMIERTIFYKVSILKQSFSDLSFVPELEKEAAEYCYKNKIK